MLFHPEDATHSSIKDQNNSQRLATAIVELSLAGLGVKRLN